MTLESSLRIWRIIPLLLIVVLFCPFADGEVIYVDDDTITASASLPRGSYTIGQPVPIEITVTNHGQEPVYIDVDEFGYLELGVTVENVNGTKVEHGPIASPRPRPRHWWITIDGKKIFTHPIVEIEPEQTIKLTIRDALELYHGYLQEGVYYVKPRELSVIHEVDSIIIREDQEHKLWIQPSAIISRARYETNKVEITLYQGKIIYVDDNGPADFSTIQAAIDDANDGDIVIVAPGTYTGDGNRDIDFKGKAILVKSEEGPESCIIVCNLSQPLSGRPPHPVSHRGFNFHSNEDANSIVCGFTVTRGDDRNYKNEGGAFYCEESSPTIRDCIIVCNAAESGGGIWARNSRMYVSNCIITGNIAAGYGEGGGICLISGETCFVSCTISGNMARSVYHGCGVYCEGGNHQFINCTITGNRVRGERGGCGILFRAARENAICDLTNCIVWGNHAGSEDYEIRLRQSTGIVPISMELRIKHCLIGEDTSDIHDSYGMVSGNWLMADPMFACNGYWDPNGTPEDVSVFDDFWVDGDYHLKSQAGRWDPDSQSWEVDIVTSPCIDAGDPNMPVGDEPEPNGGRINIGAYGGTPQASKSYILSKIIYVDDDAVGLNDGSSWWNAYTFLQDALYDAETSEKPVEIRVAQGVYKPNHAAGNRIYRFQLINGVTLYGGYAGLTEPDPDTRDVEQYETILSGDLNGDDIDVKNPRDLFHEPTRSDNCAGIVIGNYTDRTAVLDGFIITGGRVRRNRAIIDSPTGVGGGMKNYYGSPTINNCTFIGNSAEGSGGGIGNMYDSSPILINSKFINNYGGRGGGFYNLNSNPTFINCTFTNNYADDGAGISSSFWSIWGTTQATSTKLMDCIFEYNNANDSGGGLYLYEDEAGLRNCAFISNSASKGGGLYNNSGSLNLSNCQFIGNYTQEEGGGVAGSNSKLIDCILIDNSSNGYGGGIAGNNSIYNCIMSGNTAGNNGGAIYGSGEVTNCTVIGNRAGGNAGGICTQGTVTLTNNIIRVNKALHGNEIYIGLIYKRVRGAPPIIISGTSVVTARYNTIQGGQENIPIETDCTLAWESGNIDIDPLFADPGYWADADNPNIAAEPNDPNAVWIDGDYHLKSQAGRWNPVSQSWIVDDVTSPCIDAGDPNSPIGHEPLPNGGIINMGAYGGTAEASKSIRP